MRILTWKQSWEHPIWELAPLSVPYYKWQVAAVSCDKVNKEYQVLASASQVRGDGSQAQRALCPGSLSLTQLRWFLHILLSSQTKYFCRGNVYAQEERAFQSLWNLSWSTPTQIAEMAQLAHYRVSTASRSFSFGFALSLQCRLVNGDIYWERVTFKILKITFKASHQTIAQV